MQSATTSPSYSPEVQRLRDYVAQSVMRFRRELRECKAIGSNRMEFYFRGKIDATLATAARTQPYNRTQKQFTRMLLMGGY